MSIWSGSRLGAVPNEGARLPCVIAAATALLAALLPLGCLDAARRAGGRSGLSSVELFAEQAPPARRLYTSTAAIHALAADGEGGVWAATGGGVLHWERSLAIPPRCWTVADGLPSNDVAGITALPPVGVGSAGLSADAETSAGDCVVGLPTSSATVAPAAGAVAIIGAGGPSLPIGAGVVTAWARIAGGGCLAATSEGFWYHRSGRDGGWSLERLPDGSPASHVSALLAASGKWAAYAALFGDGLYLFSPGVPGGRWKRVDRSPACRAITALAQTGNRMVIGTSGDGAFVRLKSGRWSALGGGAGEMPSMDVESVAVWHGSTWLATFDRGVLRLADEACNDSSGVGEEAVAAAAAADAGIKNPRELVAAGECLYCRDADSRLFVCDGSSWRRADWARALPRPDVYCCDYAAAEAPDGSVAGRVYVGGWGGWASWDGARLESRFSDPALAGQVVTCIAADPDSDSVWIGTQGKGLLRYDQKTGDYAEFHEAQGLTDDWVTSICVQNGRVLVGTYTGGLMEMQGARLSRTLDTGGYAIRASGVSPSGEAFAATPLGVYRQPAGGGWQLIDPQRTGGRESQCLCLTRRGLWIGGRTSLQWLAQDGG